MQIFLKYFIVIRLQLNKLQSVLFFIDKLKFIIIVTHFLGNLVEEIVITKLTLLNSFASSCDIENTKNPLEHSTYRTNLIGPR